MSLRLTQSLSLLSSLLSAIGALSTNGILLEDNSSFLLMEDNVSVLELE